MTLPCRSVIVTIVLLNVLLMCAAPCGTFFFSRRRVFWPFLGAEAAAFLAGGMTGARIGLGALTAPRQAAAVPNALVAADLDLASDVGLHLTAQVTLDLEVAFDVVAQMGHLIVGEVLGATIFVDLDCGQDFVITGTANAEDIGQRAI